MDKKFGGELIMSLLLAVVGAASVGVIQTQQSGGISNTGATDFKTFPTIFGGMLAVLAVVNTIRVLITWNTAKKTAGKNEESPVEVGQKDKGSNQKTAIRVTLMFLLCMGFALLMKVIPFAALVFLFLFLSFFILGQRKLLVNAAVALGGSGIVHLVFIVLLKLPL